MSIDTNSTTEGTGATTPAEPDDAPAVAAAPDVDAPRLTFAKHLRDDRTPARRREEILADPGFGKFFTDHVLSATWTADAGWHSGRIEPYGPIPMDPASAVLHYAQEILGTQGLPAPGRVDLGVPAGGERRPAAAVRTPVGAAGAARRGLRGRGVRAGRDGRRLGALGA